MTLRRTRCGFRRSGSITFCVKTAGHFGRHLDKYRRVISEPCEMKHPRLKVYCSKDARHQGPHSSGRFTWSNV